ncbi:hypothetical protein LXL04_004026 [Taraxacum kok-saghyz]
MTNYWYMMEMKVGYVVFEMKINAYELTNFMLILSKLMQSQSSVDTEPDPLLSSFIYNNAPDDDVSKDGSHLSSTVPVSVVEGLNKDPMTSVKENSKELNTKEIKLSSKKALKMSDFSGEWNLSTMLRKRMVAATELLSLSIFTSGAGEVNPVEERNLTVSLPLSRAVQMRTIIGGGNGGTNLGHLFHFAADQFSDAGALLSAQHILFSPKQKFAWRTT